MSALLLLIIGGLLTANSNWLERRGLAVEGGAGGFWGGKFSLEVLKVAALFFSPLNSFFSHAIRYQPQGKLQIFGTLSKRLGGVEHKQEAKMDASVSAWFTTCWFRSSASLVWDLYRPLFNSAINFWSQLCPSVSKTLHDPLWMLNILDNKKVWVDVFVQESLSPSLLISQEEVAFLCSGKWLMRLSCLVNAITECLKRSPSLRIRVKKASFF